MDTLLCHFEIDHNWVENGLTNIISLFTYLPSVDYHQLGVFMMHSAGPDCDIYTLCFRGPGLRYARPFYGK